MKETTHTRTVPTILFHLHKTLENAHESILTESISVTAEGWDSGRNGRKKLQRGMKRLEGDGYIQY